MATFISVGACLTRALCDAAKVLPPVCARCTAKLEPQKAAAKNTEQAASCSCGA